MSYVKTFFRFHASLWYLISGKNFIVIRPAVPEIPHPRCYYAVKKSVKFHICEIVHIFTYNSLSKQKATSKNRINGVNTTYKVILMRLLNQYLFDDITLLLISHPPMSNFVIFLVNPPPPLASDILFEWPHSRNIIPDITLTCFVELDSYHLSTQEFSSI